MPLQQGMKPETNTARIGHTDDSVRIPNPDLAPIAEPRPEPSESTSGTVIGPVVTPAESQAMLSAATVSLRVRDGCGRQQTVGAWTHLVNSSSAKCVTVAVIA